MKRPARVGALSALLALAILGLTVSPGHSQNKQKQKELADARAAIEKLAGMSPADQAKAAADFAKKVGIDIGMHAAFKPRDKGGIGVGPQGAGIIPDSIELKIMALAKKAPTKMAVAKEGQAIEKMAQITRAMAEATGQWAPKEKKPGKDPKDWAKYTEDMKKGAQELEKAAKSGDPDAIKNAASKVNSSCVECHSKFRDS
jgi:soluble cytochrome b562